jgi:hypothetical protein
MAVNATITALVATVQTGLTAGAALPADILALSSGLVSEGLAYRDTVQARRVGIIAGDINVTSYNGDASLNKDAAHYNECINSEG